MMKRIKETFKIPECLALANITILHKKKCKLDLKNWCGIFVSSVLRTILIKLVHGLTYEMVNENIGARKYKSVRNHLFLLNSVISEVMSSVKKTPIDITIMDFKQMFDSEELETVINSFYEAEIKDDMIGLVYEANKSVTFAVKTPSGLTSKRTIRNKIMQGDVMSPLVSSNMVDENITKIAMATQNFYIY